MLRTEQRPVRTWCPICPTTNSPETSSLKTAGPTWCNRDNVFNNTPGFVYLTDGLSAGPIDLPLNTSRGLEVRPFAGKVLLSGTSSIGITHLFASADLTEFRDVSDFPDDDNSEFLRVAFLRDDEIYYTRRGDNSVQELVRTDTLGAELEMIVDLNPGQESISFFGYRYDPGTQLLYYLGLSAEDESVTLYRSDLTAPGTFALTLVQPQGVAIENLGSSNELAGGSYYFRAYREDSGEELWVTDGSVNGTRLLVDLVPGPDGARIKDPTRNGERIIFLAETLTQGEEVRHQ